eukprot:403365615
MQAQNQPQLYQQLNQQNLQYPHNFGQQHPSQQRSSFQYQHQSNVPHHGPTYNSNHDQNFQPTQFIFNAPLNVPLMPMLNSIFQPQVAQNAEQTVPQVPDQNVENSQADNMRPLTTENLGCLVEYQCTKKLSEFLQQDGSNQSLNVKQSDIEMEMDEVLIDTSVKKPALSQESQQILVKHCDQEMKEDDDEFSGNSFTIHNLICQKGFELLDENMIQCILVCSYDTFTRYASPSIPNNANKRFFVLRKLAGNIINMKKLTKELISMLPVQLRRLISNRESNQLELTKQDLSFTSYSTDFIEGLSTKHSICSCNSMTNGLNWEQIVSSAKPIDLSENFGKSNYLQKTNTVGTFPQTNMADKENRASFGQALSGVDGVSKSAGVNQLQQLDKRESIQQQVQSKQKTFQSSVQTRLQSKSKTRLNDNSSTTELMKGNNNIPFSSSFGNKAFGQNQNGSQFGKFSFGANSFTSTVKPNETRTQNFGSGPVVQSTLANQFGVINNMNANFKGSNRSSIIGSFGVNKVQENKLDTDQTPHATQVVSQVGQKQSDQNMLNEDEENILQYYDQKNYPPGYEQQTQIN